VSRRGRGDGGIYRDPDRNRWVGQLDLGIGPDGKRLRRKVVGRTKSDVAAKLRALRKEHDGRPGTTPGVQTVGELAARWLDTAVRARHPEGSPMWETYQYAIDHHIAPGLGDRQLRTVTADDVDRFLMDRARSGYSRSVVRRIRNTLSQVFRWGPLPAPAHRDDRRGRRTHGVDPSRRGSKLGPPFGPPGGFGTLSQTGETPETLGGQGISEWS
jgi:hypothetical protein